MDHILKANGLSKAFKKRLVVDNVSIELHQGEIVGLLGPNGAGKTTTFRLITGEIDSYAGQILFDNQDIAQWPMYRRARLGISYLPQESSAFRGLSTEDNVMAVLQINGYSKKQIQERLESLLSQFEMGSRRKIKARNLSGGERRRLEVMRAIALFPSFVLLDEPFATLDPISVEELQRIIAQLRASNIGVLLTDHNVHETLAIADRAYIISEGKVLLHGTPKEIAHNAIARRVFLGEQFKLEGAQ